MRYDVAAYIRAIGFRCFRCCRCRLLLTVCLALSPCSCKLCSGGRHKGHGNACDMHCATLSMKRLASTPCIAWRKGHLNLLNGYTVRKLAATRTRSSRLTGTPCSGISSLQTSSSACWARRWHRKCGPLAGLPALHAVAGSTRAVTLQGTQGAQGSETTTRKSEVRRTSQKRLWLWQQRQQRHCWHAPPSAAVLGAGSSVPSGHPGSPGMKC